jgi:hypothetical protein
MAMMMMTTVSKRATTGALENFLCVRVCKYRKHRNANNDYGTVIEFEYNFKNLHIWNMNKMSALLAIIARIYLTFSYSNKNILTYHTATTAKQIRCILASRSR